MNLNIIAVKTLAEHSVLKKTLHRFVHQLACRSEFILNVKALANKEHTALRIVKNRCRIGINERHIFIGRRKTDAVVHSCDIFVQPIKCLASDFVFGNMLFNQSAEHLLRAKNFS